MKRFALAALLLASTTAFAQAEPQAAPTSPTEVARAIGRNMGTLPVIQEACGGYTVKQRNDLKLGLAKMASQFATKPGTEFADSYTKGFREGGDLMANQITNIAKDRLSGLCQEFNAKYPEIMANLNKSTQQK